MPLIRNAKVIFNEIPSGSATDENTLRYEDTDKIDTDIVALNGGFLVKTLVLSLHLFQRLMMRAPDGNPALPPAYVIGQPIQSIGIAKVIRSETEGVQAGEYVYGFIAHQEYSIVPSLFPGILKKMTNPYNLALSVLVGSAGMLGQTGYYGWKEYSKAKKGDTVFVTTGAGPVGSMVIQLAKQEGLKVIASAGSDKKVEFMKSLGADVVFNYKTTKTAEILKKEGPIDVYWDNVGGETLEAALNAAKRGARFIECGMASRYESGEETPVTNLMLIIRKEITLSGFITTSLESKWEAEYYADVPEKFASGELKANDEVIQGLKNVGDAMRRTLLFQTHGAVVISVATD